MTNESVSTPDDYVIRPQYCDRVINIAQRPLPKSLPGDFATLVPDDRFNIALFTGHSERLGIHLMTQPWRSAEYLARESRGRTNPHGIRYSLDKLVDVGAAERRRYFGYRLRVPIDVMSEMLVGPDDFILPEGSSDLWNIRGIVPYHYRDVFLALIELFDQRGDYLTVPRDFAELQVAIGCKTPAGIHKKLARLCQGDNPLLVNELHGRQSAYHLAFPELAQIFAQRQYEPWTVMPVLVEPASYQDRLDFKPIESISSFIRCTSSEVKFKTPKLKQPMTLSPDFVYRLGFFCAAVELHEKRLTKQPITIPEMRELAQGSLTYNQLKSLMTKLTRSGLVSFIKGQGYVPQVPVEALKTLVQGKRDQPLPTPQADYWGNKRLFLNTEIDLIHAVAGIIRRNGQFITNQDAAQVAESLGIPIDLVVYRLHSQLSSGPRSPFVRLDMTTHIRAYGIRGSELPTINRVAQTNQAQLVAFVLKDNQLESEGVVEFSRQVPPDQGYPTWQQLGFRVEILPKKPDQQTLEAVVGLLESPLRLTQLAPRQSQRSEYVGPFPIVAINQAISLLNHLSVTSPESLADLVSVCQQPSLGDTLRAIEKESPNDLRLIPIKCRLAEIAYSKRFGTRQILSLNIDDIINELQTRLSVIFEGRMSTTLDESDDCQIPNTNPTVIGPSQDVIRDAVSAGMTREISSVRAGFRSEQGGYRDFICLDSVQGSSSVRQDREFPTVWLLLSAQGLAYTNEFCPDDARDFISAGGVILLRLIFDQKIRSAFRSRYPDGSTEQLICLLTRTCTKSAFGQISRSNKDPFMQYLVRQFFKADSIS